MKKIFFGFAVAVLTMCLTACNNKGVKQNEPTEEPQSKVLEAFADSVNGVAPMKWANVGDIEEVVYKDKVMTFTVKAPEELMEPSIKKWLSSFIVNNVHVLVRRCSRNAWTKNVQWCLSSTRPTRPRPTTRLT